MKKTRLIILTIGILVLSSAILLSGCKKEAEKKSGTYKYKNEKSEGKAEVGENLKMPANFPDDVPVYKNATVKSTSTNKADKAELIVVVLETDDSLKDVGEFYEDKLAKNGFDIENRFDTDKSIALNTRKGDMSVVVAITRNDDKTIVGINVTTRKD